MKKDMTIEYAIEQNDLNIAQRELNFIDDTQGPSYVISENWIDAWMDA